MHSRRQAAGFSSLGYSNAVYAAVHPGPVLDRGALIQTGHSAAQPRIPAHRIDQHTTLVNREPRMIGIRWLFAYGGQIKPWFRNIATGQVESTKFQPITVSRLTGEFNDAIFQAGYPRNLGYTFQVQQARFVGAGPRMRPGARILAAPYVSGHATTSGIPPVPLIPSNQLYG
jgi:hypothetical protein